MGAVFSLSVHSRLVPPFQFISKRQPRSKHPSLFPFFLLVLYRNISLTCRFFYIYGKKLSGLIQKTPFFLLVTRQMFDTTKVVLFIFAWFEPKLFFKKKESGAASAKSRSGGGNGKNKNGSRLQLSVRFVALRTRVPFVQSCWFCFYSRSVFRFLLYKFHHLCGL